MQKKQVSYEISSDGIMKVVIDNPETKNGLNWEGINQMADCYQELIDNKSIKVAIFTGNDEYFWTGGRVNPHNPGEQEKYANAIERVGILGSQIKVPRIAAVSGDCMKGAMGMVVSCEFAIAREGVRFSFPEVPMGGVPMVVMVETMDAIPRKKALEYYLSGWSFSAEEALSFGFINAVAPKEEFWNVVERYAKIFVDTPKPLIDLTLKAYNELSRIQGSKERNDFAMKMLREEVLPVMETVKQKYNP